MAEPRHASQRAGLWARLRGRPGIQPQAAAAPTQSVTELVRRRLQLEDFVGAASPNAHAAAFASRDLIARLVSTLPIHEFERAADGRLVKVDQQPTLLDTPEDDLDINDWIYAQLFGGVLTAGMSFGLVAATDGPDSASRVLSLSPQSVSLAPRKSPLEPPQWLVEGKPEAVWPVGRLWIVRGYPVPGSPVSLSPLQLARLTINIGLGARRFADEFFRDGRVPAGVITHPETQPPDVVHAVQRVWVDETRDSREPRILTGGWSFQPERVMAEESQFLATINANAADVARFFGVAPEDIGASSGGGSVTYANVEQRGLQLVTRTIGPWVVRLERRLTRLRPPGRVIRFNLDGLLRTDQLTRERIINDGVRVGKLSINEARQLADRPGIGQDGDRYVWPPYRAQLSTPELEQGADQLSPAGDGPSTDSSGAT
jgi:hypothetical protein